MPVVIKQQTQRYYTWSQKKINEFIGLDICLTRDIQNCQDSDNHRNAYQKRMKQGYP